ncbi:uncharacterized protein BX664DRAFT_314290 [Halteromyces radiatus]|uniref:uncharacterized protein n=1 Tax=Halteromyces radiatus TaxID=101107 RepID=UPI00221E52D9|nr:uncharacterized protein BX664DRAFT_314290 [Halteromyces radiatus]KAI8089047.1 hypothetical protein BX664DRAFT_314290 [Halteromyces radiatus]
MCHCIIPFSSWLFDVLRKYNNIEQDVPFVSHYGMIHTIIFVIFLAIANLQASLLENISIAFEVINIKFSRDRARVLRLVLRTSLFVLKVIKVAFQGSIYLKKINNSKKQLSPSLNEPNSKNSRLFLFFFDLSVLIVIQVQRSCQLIPSDNNDPIIG